MSENFDDIQRAAHYNISPATCKHGHQLECRDVTDHMNMNIGSAVKYLWRAGLKPGNDSVKDIRKAIRFLEFEIEKLGGKTRQRELSVYPDGNRVYAGASQDVSAQAVELAHTLVGRLSDSSPDYPSARVKEALDELKPDASPSEQKLGLTAHLFTGMDDEPRKDS